MTLKRVFPLESMQLPIAIPLFFSTPPWPSKPRYFLLLLLNLCSSNPFYYLLHYSPTYFPCCATTHHNYWIFSNYIYCDVILHTPAIFLLCFPPCCHQYQRSSVFYKIPHVNLQHFQLLCGIYLLHYIYIWFDSPLSVCHSKLSLIRSLKILLLIYSIPPSNI